MKPIIGEIAYKDMTPEDIERFIHDAQVMRSEAISEIFKGLGRAISGLFKAPAKTANASAAPIIRGKMIGAQ